MAINLDNIESLRPFDRHNMLGLIESFPEQCEKAKDIGYSFNVPAKLKRQYKNVIITGLGGSAIGADIARSYAADEANIPIAVNRNYNMPGYVDKDSLVVAASYSGNTEETISAYKDAVRKSAAVVVITSGGQLQAHAEADNAPFINVPAGMPPRASLGYSFFTLLALLSKLNITGDKSGQIDSAIETLKDVKASKAGQTVAQKNNIAKKIAGEIYLKYPVIYSGQDHIDAAATRWRGQLAENAKTLSSTHVFPEMTHNEIVGWEYPKEILKNFIVIMLRDSSDHPRVAKRMDITRDILAKEKKINVIEVHSEGEGLLSRIFSIIYIGDFVSYYLAILNKTDPTPVDRITYLKDELAKK